MDKKNYQKPSVKEVMVEECLLLSDSDPTQGPNPGGGGSRVSRDFGEEE